METLIVNLQQRGGGGEGMNSVRVVFGRRKNTVGGGEGEGTYRQNLKVN